MILQDRPRDRAEKAATRGAPIIKDTDAYLSYP
jgi:hypothetical protein